MGTTPTTNPALFTGNSAFSSDLQQVITRAVSFASLPTQQLQNELGNLTNQQSEIETLSADFQSLQSAIDSINNSAGSGAYTASVDNTSVASASIGAGAAAGTYTVNVVSLGSQTNTTSKNGLAIVTDPSSANIDSSSAYTLTVNGQSFQITDSAGSLNGLAQAINSSGANVQATVLNLGSSSSPDYRLSIQSSKYAPDSIQLSDGTNSLLNTLSTGSYVTYQVNGQPSTPIDSESRTVGISPGLSVNLLQQGTANVTVSQSASGAASAFTSFASAYNTIVDELSKSRGKNGGPLSGQGIVYSLTDSLKTIANYAGSTGSISSIADLGLTFDQNGHLNFDPSTFNKASSNSVSDVLNYIGGESTGGFLQAASNVLASLNDPTTGTLPLMTQSIGKEMTDVGNKITDDQTRVNQLQQNLTAQMAAADAAISTLEQQASYITSLFSAMQQNSNSSNGH